MTRSEADADAVSGPGDQVPMRGGDGDDGQGGTQSDARPQEQQLIVSRFFRGGKLRQFPVKRKARVAVLLELVSLLEPGRTYSEPEVSELLGRIHGDYATLRRELVDYGYVLRDAGV